MNCPLCKTPLARIEYESFYLYRCGACHGHLVAERRIDAIERRRDKTVEDLKQDVDEHLQPDSDHKLRCPRCKAFMRKRGMPQALFHTDACRGCELVWFDGGELSLLQLRHENTAQGREQVELQRRLAAMTEEQQAEFAANLAKMKPGFQTPEELLVEMMLQQFAGRRQRRHTAWFDWWDE
jgi:Zn-finger nucleic acid-binding protein